MKPWITKETEKKMVKKPTDSILADTALKSVEMIMKPDIFPQYRENNNQLFTLFYKFSQNYVCAFVQLLQGKHYKNKCYKCPNNLKNMVEIKVNIFSKTGNSVNK